MPHTSSILIADDDEPLAQSVAALLGLDGYHCDCVLDADRAIERLETRRYDLLISDVQMPGNHNFRLVWEARQIDPEMPIILFTGSESVVREIKLPVVACLAKLDSHVDLRAHVRAAIECDATG